MAREIKLIKLVESFKSLDIEQCSRFNVLTGLKDDFYPEATKNNIIQFDMTGIDIVVPSVASSLIKSAYELKRSECPIIITGASKEIILSIQQATTHASLPISFWILDQNRESFLAGEIRHGLLNILDQMRSKPHGASTEEIASLMGIKTTNASVQLHFLCAEGLIDREKVSGTQRSDRNSRGWTYFYTLLFYKASLTF